MEARKDDSRWKKWLVRLIRLALVALWVPVAVDKLWDLPGFHRTLLRQPFPDWWADILFWLLPLLELLAAVLIAWPARKPANRNQHVASTVGRRGTAGSGGAASHPLRLGLWLSTILLLGFTLFILFGVLGWYAKRPCGCGSVISGLTWEQHLWFNLSFLLLSILGIWLTWPRSGYPSPAPSSSRCQEGFPYKSFPNYTLLITLFKIRFPRKFAVFRRGAVGTSKKGGGSLKQASPVDDGSLQACRR